MDLTPNQIQKLQSLGVYLNDQPKVNDDNSQTTGSFSLDITTSPKTNDFQQPVNQTKTKSNNIFPLLSISGLTLLSFSGLILFKSRGQTTSTTPTSNTTLPETNISPTQVPKSIQHYLLTSQQYFSRALQSQSSQNPATAGSESDQPQTIDNLNQAILSATEAIKEFPNDYRGYYQRGRIYQSVLTSKPELSSQVISDLSQAQKLDPSNAEITRSLASAYAQAGDAQNTINYLSQTISLDPTKAQNFYDLAKIQQQVGLLTQAVTTYNQLLTLISDPAQKTQIETEKSSLEKLIAQNINHSEASAKDGLNNFINPIPTINLPSSLDSPTIQASASTGLIVAAPEELDQVKVTNLTTSNSLSGQSILPANQKELTITNSQLTANSQVYVSITRGGKNQNLQVLSKSEKSFTIGLDSSITEDIEFNWWIIN